MKIVTKVLKPKHSYFVSYTFVQQEDGTRTLGTGMVNINQPDRIKTFDDVRKVANSIKRGFDFESVAVLNYKRVKFVKNTKVPENATQEE